MPGIVFRNLTFEADRLLPDLVTLGGRLTLVGGKGGVGKTTTAAALALALAERGREVLVLSVDPAHSLGDALGVELGGEPSPVPGGAGLMAMEIDPERERQRFLGTHRGALLRILERGTYLDAEDAAGLVDLAVPGMDELAALFRLLELTADEGRHLVVDTAPTGHALRLLDLPRAARQWMAALEAMEAKHRAVAGALVGGLPEDEGARLLEALDSDLARLEALLTSADRCRFLLVTTPEPVVLAETRRYEAELTRRTVALGGVIVNRSRAGVPAHALGAGMVFVPPLADEPRGPDGLRRFAASARDAPVAEGGRREAAPAGIRVDGAWAPPTDRTLYLVGGKGGVGKSTSAAALALCVAERRPGRVLLLGTDPAGSLGDVLGVEVGGAAAPVRGQPGLWVQQVDAHAGWQRFRERYRAEVELLFEGLVSRGLSASSDQRVVERLLDLAPPGLDELVALLEVVDASGDGVYDALVVDTAPTGHLLRLLQLPELALQWTHTLLRLLLKYREVIGLGELAERVLQLARSLRSLQGRLRDPRDCWFLAVALPESLSVPETERLLASLRELQVPVGGVLLNRLLDEHGEPRPQGAAHARALIDRAGPLPCVAAPDLAEAPRGVEGLRRLAAGWRKVGGGEKGDRLDRNGNRA